MRPIRHRMFSMRFVALVMLAMAAAASVAAAEIGKTLRVTSPTAETSFDPAFASDAVSDAVIYNVIESMLDYDYLVRPVKLIPRTLVAMPTVEDGGKTYICRIRKGIRYTDDPAFHGQPRELTALDYAYSLKRILDPAVKSPWLWVLEGKLEGGDAARANAKSSGRFDYDAPIPGLEVVDRYTLKIRLREPDLRFRYALAIPNLGAVAREVVEAYGVDIGAHPVGTGPYVLAEYKRSSRIVLAANPGYRRTTYVPAGPVPEASKAIAAALAGKPLPRTGRIEISIIEETQSAWLAFMKGELDIFENVPGEFIEQALADGKLKPEFVARGIVHEETLRPNVYFTYFNMKDPVVGGYTNEKIALRRAIAMGIDVSEAVRVLLNGRARLAENIVPPDVVGHDPRLRTDAQRYDPAAARALLDRFGYKDRDGDGYREMPDGTPLVLDRWSVPTSRQRQSDELWKKSMDAIGIRLVIHKDKLPELRKMARLGKIPMRDDGWNADYPDAENFMQMLYGPNAGQENIAQFDLPEFNRLYDEARKLPDSPERTRRFDRMNELVVTYAPWRLRHYLLEDNLLQPWVRNFRGHPIRSQVWQYLDIADDRAARPAK